MKTNKIDKAVFYHIGTETYECRLFEKDQLIGVMLDTKGRFIDIVEKYLRKNHPQIQIDIVKTTKIREMQD